MPVTRGHITAIRTARPGCAGSVPCCRPNSPPLREHEERHAAQVTGVIARSQGAPVEVVTILVPDPGPGEAVVRVLACGVCHTDLHYREGGISQDFPFLLGHEASGIVEEVGEVSPTWRPGTS